MFFLNNYVHASSREQISLLTIRGALNLQTLVHLRKLSNWYEHCLLYLFDLIFNFSSYFLDFLLNVFSVVKLYHNRSSYVAIGYNDWCQVNEGYSILDGS